VTTERPSPIGQWLPEERSLLPSVLGIPPLAAVGLAFGFTALGVFVDLQRIGTVGAVFQVLYFSGCVLAAAWVRRRNLFGPLVQPPLLLAVAIPVVVVLSGAPRPGAGVAEDLLTVGAPLVNSFPTMAVTTGAVLAVGTVRLFLQREKAAPTARDSAAARAAARTPGTPRRS
jgi:hypothetical protein